MSQTKHFGVITIDPQGDLLIEVSERDYEAWEANGEHPVVATATFKVSREIILKKQCSENVKSYLKNPQNKSITFDQYSVGAVELWMRGLHGALTTNLDQLSIQDVWNAIAFVRYSEFDMNDLKGWSDKYFGSISWGSLDFDDLRQLLYPCFAFNHARAFAIASRRLAIQGGAHVTELSGTSRFDNLHVPARVIDQINAAKGSMRSRILQALFNPTEPKKFCEKNCPARDHCITAYLEAVQATDIWPLHKQHTKSIQQIIDSPGFVAWKCRKPEGACTDCLGQLEGDHVDEIRGKTMTYWEGLCLDCMDLSQPKTTSLHDDYWSHNLFKEWSRGCRLKHTRNTWYHSFMGRPEIMDQYQKDQDERNKQERMAGQGNSKTRARSGF